MTTQTKRHRPGVLTVAWALLVMIPGVQAASEEQSKTKEEWPKVNTTRTEAGKESKIRVLLPTPDAALYFDNALTRATGKERRFRSPALEDGKRYTYKVTVFWRENGREVSHETKIVFRAGEDVSIDFRH